MKLLALLTAAALLIASHATAQTKNVTKTISTNGLVENLVVPSGKTLTINAGGSIINNGTATGFTASAVWGGITGTLSSQLDLQSALDAKASTSSLSAYLTAAAAASSYQPLDGDLTSIAALTTTSFGRELLTRADAAATRSALGLGTLATQSATITDYLTSSNAALTYQPLDSQLTTLAALADASGVLTNNGSGTFSYTATSTGGNTLGTDAGKIAVYSDSGEFTAASAIRLTSGPTVMGIWFGSHRLASSASGLTKTWTLPNVTGTLITTGDTATVTDTMLAGSITPSKITGTAAILGANTFTGIQTLPAGTVSAPSLTFTGAGTNTGIYSSGSNIIDITIGGVRRYWLDGVSGLNTSGVGIQITNGNFITNSNIFTRGGAFYMGASDDLIISRDAAATLQLGSDSATPISQTIKTADGSGTNIAASNLTLGGSRSTGTGVGGDVISITSMTGTSGTAANTTQERSRVIGRFINLTESTATNLVSIALASGKVTGGTATLTVWASDGTDHQALTSEIRFAAVNKAGTVTATCTQTDGTTAASTGTLTVTYDAIASGNNVILRANATSSLTQTTLRSRIVITALNGDDTQVVSPQ